MIRWLLLISALFISAFMVGFGEMDASTEMIAKAIYFTTTILLVTGLLVRDVQRKEL